MINLTVTVVDPDKPLRRDAERNRQRILTAARELFAQRGLGATLNDVAHHAGVGVGTVYRRFPDKSRLIDELFEERLAELVALMEQAAADPDPWHGVLHYMERALELQAQDCALKDLVTGTPDGAERVCRIRDRLLPLGEDLIARAQASGRLRPGITASDVPIIQLMLGAVMDASREVDPDLWRRYLEIFVRGLSADPPDPEPLAPGPLSPEQLDHVMSQSRLSAR